MAVVYHEIYLPIDTESTFDYIVIKQGDAGTHRVRATLISNNRVYTIPTSGASYFMKFRKPDNNYCLVEATVSDNTISAEVTEEMLRVSGTGRGEFMIVSGSNELKSATFHVKIVRQTFTSGDVQSHSDFAPFAALLQGAGAAASNANTAAAAANAAASLAERKAQAIPDDYSELVADVAGKADKSTTYTKTEVDQMIEDVEVETDTTLTISGAPADAKKTGDELSALKADLDALDEKVDNEIETLDSKIDNIDVFPDAAKEALLDCFEHIALWTEGDGREYIDVLRAALGSIYPDLSTGNIIANYYYDASGNMVASNHAYCNEKYFEIENGTDYYWIQGFNGSVGGVKPDYTGAMNAYRVCYYDENKNFISRQVNDYSSEFGVIEPRYMKLTIPTGAKYFRVSWSLLPCGVICKTIPTNLYAVTIVLANLDDSEISNNSDIVSRFSVTRKGTDITQLAKTGIPNVTPEDSFELYGGWLRNVFSVLSGGSPEYGNQNLETMTRIHNKHTYIMRKGDVISFDNVKAGVRAERISDGEVQHNTAWITDNSDFVVGGES